MLSEISTILGGLGLFLLGMAVMVDGLKNLAGEALRKILSTFTKNPLTGALTGTATTAIVQSSSVTTVMAVGFVGAGLLTFPQSLGVVFGANVGTTVTGWIVALLGFKLNLIEIVLPLIFLGALLRLTGRRRLAAAGFVLAGFGLVFAGVATLQSGLEAFQDVVTPDVFPPDTVAGRLLLVLIGFAITLVTQSSSAGVATAITAVHVGNISLSQAAAMVIGMDVGTTVTAVVAGLTGNVHAKRTGLGHLIYNLMTGVGAFLILPVYIRSWETIAPALTVDDPELVLVSFHSSFNILGTLIAIPLTRQFAALIIRLAPAGESVLTRRLEPSLLNQPHVAIDAVQSTLDELVEVTFSSLATLLSPRPAISEATRRIDDAELATIETRRYLADINPSSGDQQLSQRLANSLHILDHLARLIVRCRKHDRIKATRLDSELADWASQIAASIAQDATDESAKASARLQSLESLWTRLDERNQSYRRETVTQTAAGKLTTDRAIAQLDAIRWLRRVSYHAWRIVVHMSPKILVTETPELDIDPGELD